MSIVAKRLDGLRSHLVWTMEVGLGSGDVVLVGDPAPPKRGTAPQFSAHVYWPNGWVDEDALGTEV